MNSFPNYFLSGNFQRSFWGGWGLLSVRILKNLSGYLKIHLIILPSGGVAGWWGRRRRASLSRDVFRQSSAGVLQRRRLFPKDRLSRVLPRRLHSFGALRRVRTRAAQDRASRRDAQSTWDSATSGRRTLIALVDFDL